MRRIARGGSWELEVRRSRFVCTLARVDDQAAAAAFVAGHRRAHRDATHNCSAYVVGALGEFTRSSDDGEPAGTAGAPMLEVLVRRGLTGTAAVVTRYFGGVKLGAGGLARAYGQAVADAVSAAGVVELVRVVSLTVALDHGPAARYLGDLRARSLTPVAVRYGASVEVDVRVPVPDADAFERWTASATSGRALVAHGEVTHAEEPLR
ncbi:IMPACT family protein [Actinomadura flavalba]|uniref:IMPACT family protein n=1 Tax=Actinomadura flavalba TaxID=1120938 RepID=UPI0004756101|nr:YigZ family protein [Actinomadura flavalba]